MYHGSGKSIPLTYEEDIDRHFSSGFEQNRILHQTAKQVFGNRSPLRCFHKGKQEDFMNVRNEIKAQIIRAGFTMHQMIGIHGHDRYVYFFHL